MTEKNFKASLGSTAIMLSVLTGFIFIIVALSLWVLIKEEGQYNLIRRSFASILLFFLMLYFYLNQPMSYTITDHRILIIRRLGKFTIERNAILSVEQISDDKMGLPVRVFGNGGLFGFTGWYYSRSQGKMRWFVTQRGNYVKITLSNGKKIIISPDEPWLFVQGINAS